MTGTVRRVFGISVAMLGAVLFVGSAWPLAASAAAATPATPLVKVAQNTKLGNLLTDSQGMTLYTYKKDKPNESACAGSCASVWPPFTVTKDMQSATEPGIPGKLGRIQRQDGTNQITYNGMPLYRYTGDQKPGDMNGQGRANAWSVVSTTTSATAGSGAASKGW